jgi:hypothetical protein
MAKSVELMTIGAWRSSPRFGNYDHGMDARGL